MLDTLVQDLRHAGRFLTRRPLVTGVATLSLALGIGVNTAIFSVFNRLLLQSLPVQAPEELVNVSSPGPHPGNTSTGDAGKAPHVFTHPLFRDLERVQTSFTSLGGFRDIRANLAFRGETTSEEGLLVSGGYFGTLRLRPALGRLLTAEDDRDAGVNDVVVLSHLYWTRRFNANPSVLNETLTINGVPMTIVGVAPEGFKGTSTMDLERFFVPLRMAPRITRWRDATSRRDWFIYVFGRMKPGMTMAQAEAAFRPSFQAVIRDIDLPAQAARLRPEARSAYAKRTVLLEPGSRGHNANRDETMAVLSILFAVTGFVLLIACANVANLLLARASERAGEIAVRRAVGASFAGILRLMFMEAALLSLLGAAGAMLVARMTLAGLLRLMPGSDAEMLGVSLDAAALLFTAGLGLLTALVFGLAPAVHSLRRTADMVPAAQARTTNARSTTRLRSLLAGSQVALATTLLALAGLLVASLANLARVDLGVQRAGLSMFRIAPVLNGYRPPQSMALFDQVTASLRQTPGVVSVSAATVPLLADTSNGSDMTVTGFTPGPDDDRHAQSSDVGERYFATLGIPLIAGREFTAADAEGAPPVAIVNEAFARKFRLGRNAVGARIGTEGRPPDTEIVGIVADAAYESAREAPPAQFFRPYRQVAPGLLTFYVRTARGVDPASVMSAIPPLVHRFDANLPVEAMRTMDEQFDDNTTSERVAMTLSASLAALATILAAIGLYAVLAYSVSQRVREIGIRMALGARGADVRLMVLSQTSRIAVTASVIGVALAIGLARLTQSMLYGVTPLDPRVQGGAALLMLAVAFAAAMVPARRAAAVDPVDALRAE
jgi:putative ABC transport system permease protein